LNEAAERLINEYELELYADLIRKAAQQAAEVARSDQDIVPRGKADLKSLLVSRQQEELVGGRLGRMQLYKIWNAKKINGNEWLFYPHEHTNDPHISWVVGSKEVHVKFDPSEGQKPVTIYYNEALAFARIAQNGEQPKGTQRPEADKIITYWKASMAIQPKLRQAITEFLS
jgi:hypothetical protein